MPVERFEISKQTDEEFYSIVSDADSKTWPMVAACMIAVNGLYAGHAYTLLGVVQLTKDN